jgi:hypothetical protein
MGTCKKYSSHRPRTVDKVIKSKAIPINRPWRPIRPWNVKDPTLCKQSAQMVVRLSALRTLLPRNNILMFLVLISVGS